MKGRISKIWRNGIIGSITGYVNLAISTRKCPTSAARNMKRSEGRIVHLYVRHIRQSNNSQFYMVQLL